LLPSENSYLRVPKSKQRLAISEGSAGSARFRECSSPDRTRSGSV
jgi:hypothetical protein